MWIWQGPDWPTFSFDADRLGAAVAGYRHRAAQLAGGAARLAVADRQEALVLRSQVIARARIDLVVEQARYFDLYRDRLNERRHKVVGRMFTAGPAGFEGGMTAGNYVGIARCSKTTAPRDLAALPQMGALTSLPGGGRSSRYALARVAP
ncbi:DUF4172 domain-containing protein [Candidatus Thiodictyon syntrophicum]|jgi:Fic family protein|uniref:DUF4172 domain-containing protein n=1 Tax=Candidatus Thiodictyon syntrophicum TaxID=1166950 RepID=A0A2K8UEA1_9GAMM|nr:DUF4172 domain-containing protein [Candidatus Thiodictyon syntrophicum]AUB83924.1 hypothetical protein THSYN_25320 [Candidatus Thiodictyon syntrophicum]